MPGNRDNSFTAFSNSMEEYSIKSNVLAKLGYFFVLRIFANQSISNMANQFSTLITLVLLFTGIHSLLAQGEINQHDDQGRKFGPWEARYPGGQPRYSGQFKNDRPVGTFHYFYENGALRATNVFSNNGLKAYHNQFTEEGTLIAEGMYFDQKKDSIWLIYSDVDGVLLSEERYKNDLLDGMKRIYYPGTNQIAEETYYSAGLKNGKSIKYFEDGKLMLESAYVNDELDGAFTLYHANGAKRTQGNFKEGLKTGKWVIYDEDGVEISVDSYKENP